MRQGDARLITGEGSEEGDDVGVFALAKAPAQLQPAHDIDGLSQGVGTAVVEVGVSQFHVAQCGHLEVEAVGVKSGDSGAPNHGGPGTAVVGFDHTHFLERSATQVGAVVAGNAPHFVE